MKNEGSKDIRRIRWFPLLALMISFLLIISDCKKADPFSSNNSYIDKYLGTWDFKYVWSDLYVNVGLSQGDSSIFTGTINSYSPDGYITILFTEVDSLTKKVEPDGRILNTCNSQIHGSADCSGYFEGDSVFYYNYSELTPPNQVHKYTKTITGRKLSKSFQKKAPSVSTTAATGVTMKSAILCGKVNANFKNTSVSFEFGTSANYGNIVSAVPGMISGSKDINESANISGLVSGKEYHFRIKGVNSLGTAYGEDMMFRTTNSSDSVTDIDGNVYKTVPIGGQEWMTENLKVTRFNDGSAIPMVTDNSDWSILTTAGYCIYNNDPNTYQKTYGALYNWYAVKTNSLCPAGWHVPTIQEWLTLENYLGGSQIGGSLKETGSIHWNTESDPVATNNTGFTALPGGERASDGVFGFIGIDGKFWTSSAYTANDEGSARSMNLITFDNQLNQFNIPMTYGLSVRCLKGYGIIKPDTLPTLLTIDITNISFDKATSGGVVSDNGGTQIIARGVCWSTSPAPTIDDNKTSDGYGTSGYTSIVNGLSGGTTYYVRAYASNSTGTGYGNQLIFKTLNLPVAGLPVIDYDGNEYKTVIIGTQTWMAANLKTKTYSDGTPIPFVNTSNAWIGLNSFSRAYCYYNDDTTYASIYGAFYTYPAAMNGAANSSSIPSGVQGVCPVGWHIPSNNEWEILFNYLGGTDIAGGKMKESGIDHWFSPNNGATNESGFSGLPGGKRYPVTGTFRLAGYEGNFCSSDAITRQLIYSYPVVMKYGTLSGEGISVRCVKN